MIIHAGMIFVMTHFPITAVAYLAHLAAKATASAIEAATLAAAAEVEARLTIIFGREAGEIGIFAKGAKHFHDGSELLVTLFEDFRCVKALFVDFDGTSITRAA